MDELIFVEYPAACCGDEKQITGSRIEVSGLPCWDEILLLINLGNKRRHGSCPIALLRGAPPQFDSGLDVADSGLWNVSDFF